MQSVLISTLCFFVFFAPAYAAYDAAAEPHPADMLVSNTPTLNGYSIKEYKGIVRGVTVRQPTIGQGLSASLERLKGGHVSAYVAMCDTSSRDVLKVTSSDVEEEDEVMAPQMVLLCNKKKESEHAIKK